MSESAPIGDKIRFYRRKKKMLIRELAKAVGISRYAMMDYERSITEPSLDIILKISKILDVDKEKLFDNYFKFLDYPYSEKIKEIRKEKQLTQLELALLLNVSDRHTVARWESGKCNVTRNVYTKIEGLSLC